MNYDSLSDIVGVVTIIYCMLQPVLPKTRSTCLIPTYIYIIKFKLKADVLFYFFMVLGFYKVKVVELMLSSTFFLFIVC